VQDGAAKVEALNDKLKRVKLLLSRSKTLLTEREAEAAALQAERDAALSDLQALRGRPKRFGVQARVAVNSSAPRQQPQHHQVEEGPSKRETYRKLMRSYNPIIMYHQSIRHP
jgi:hypothetical protein